LQINALKSTHKLLVVHAALLILSLSVPSCTPHEANSASSTDYSSLVAFIELEDRESPLYILDDFQDALDEPSHQASIEYMNNQPALLRKIRRDLGGGELRWELDHLSQRVLYVPERRAEYVRLFEEYCRDVIRYVLKKTSLKNPYQEIRTLVHERPEMNGAGSRMNAYVVHNLASEFIATYVFSNEQNKKITLQLKGKIFQGEVGSYTSKIVLRHDGKVQFYRDGYTIWQNSAKNPYTALMVPAEETLHIALREHTERGMERVIKGNALGTLDGVNLAVQEWVAAEEAIVGGLVYSLLPGYLRNHTRHFPSSLVKKDLETKKAFKRYRYLKQGIRLVEKMGYKKALKSYMTDPTDFKKRLM
jgi:hypothetical protein